MGNQKIRIDIGEVQKTLLFPLLARARETEKRDPVILDNLAIEIINTIENDLSEFEPLLANENHQLGMAIRACHFDTIIKEFLKTHDNAGIISIGAGLDTTFHRVDNGSILWFNIEMPDVVPFRQILIPDMDREQTIGKSVFDFSWMDDIASSLINRPVLIMAAGVLFYFKESEVEEIFKELSKSYPSAHVIFDSVPWFTLWAQNREVKKGRLPQLELWKWYLKKPSELRKWVPNIEIIDEYPIYDRVRIRDSWSIHMKIGIKITNMLRLYSINHVKL